MMILAHLLSGDGSLDWNTPVLQRVLAASLRGLASLGGPGNLMAVCDSEQAQTALSAAGWPKPRRIKPVKDGDLGALLTGPDARSVLDWAPGEGQSPWLLVDLRNHALTPGVVRQALASFREHGRQTVVSSRPPLDHPFYLRLMVKALGLLLIHRLESPPAAATWLRSRNLPAAAALAECGEGVLSAPFHATLSGDSRMLTPCVRQGSLCDGIEPLWLPESPFTGRFFWKPLSWGRGREAAFSPWCGFAEDTRATCRQQDDTLEISLPGLSGEFMAHALSFDAAGLCPEGEAPAAMSQGGTLMLDFPPSCTGLAAVVLRAGQTGEYTLERRYQPDRLWSGEIRLDDGAKICGRQLLPSVLEVDFALVVADPHSFPRLGEDLARGDVVSFPAFETSLLVTPLDLLQLRAQQRDNERQTGVGHD